MPLNLNAFPAIDTLKLFFLFYVDIPVLSYAPPAVNGRPERAERKQGQKRMAVLKRGKVWRCDFVIACAIGIPRQRTTGVRYGKRNATSSKQTFSTKNLLLELEVGLSGLTADKPSLKSTTRRATLLVALGVQQVCLIAEAVQITQSSRPQNLVVFEWFGQGPL
jgi:hypothetical protein